MKRILKIYFIGILSLIFVICQAQDTITVEFGTDHIKDAYINIVNSQTNGSSQSLIASVWTHWGEYGTGRSLIGFDFSDVEEDKKVIDARLNLYHDPTSGHEGHSNMGGDNTGMIFRITEQWLEDSVTWDNQPATTNTNSVLIPAPDSEIANFLNVDITPIIQDMIRHPESSDGFMIKLFSEDSLYRSLVFTSSDHPINSLHPTIVITYVTNLPADSVYTMQPDGEQGNDAYINSIVSYTKEDQQSLVSSVWELDEGWGIGRSVINFDMSYIDPELTITLAELSLFHDPNSSIEGHYNNGESNEILISRITEYWNEDNINWDNQPTISTENQILVPSSNIQNQDYLDIDVTDIVIAMMDNPEESFGFSIRLANEESQDYNRNVVFASSDHMSPELRPRLVIYTYDYTSFDDFSNIENCVLVYPNPGKGNFKVQIFNNQDPIQYSVFDSFGNNDITGETNANEFNINLHSQPSGVYLLSIARKYNVTNKKLIKL